MAKILILDDERGITKLLSAAFARAGHDVRTATEAHEAIRVCQAEPFDVVLSDVVMPLMDGHDFARWLAATFPQTRVLLMSALDLECQDCPYLPRCTVLKKPFPPEEAVSAVARLLSSPLHPSPSRRQDADTQ